MNLPQKVAFNTVVQIASKIITVGFTLLTTILLTGYLGKEGYGDYIYILSLAIIFGSLADWGTLTIGVREVAKVKKNPGQLLANIFFLRLILAILAAILLIIVSLVLPIQVRDPMLVRRVIRIAGLLVFLVTIKASFSLVFQSKLAMQKTALSDILASGLTFLFSWYVIQRGLSLGPLIWSIIWATLLATLLAGVMALRTVSYHWRFDSKIMRRLLAESLPMGAILMMFTIDNKIDTVMLGAIKGSAAVGIYGLSSRVYDVLILGAAFLMNSMLPVLSQLTRSPKLKAVYQKTFQVMFCFSLLVVVSLLSFSPLIIKILTQTNFTKFIDAFGVLRVMSLALFLAYFNHLTGYTIVALGKQRTYFWIALGSLIFNVMANWIFIPRYSYWGASWVTVLTEGLVLIATTTYLYRKIF
jgi:O-antigen/teichoic acid export membrane protein